ncbi:MAG: hypothetical protein AB4426_10295 [Xenococcaceae cyanobacterium]
MNYQLLLPNRLTTIQRSPLIGLTKPLSLGKFTLHHPFSPSQQGF